MSWTCPQCGRNVPSRVDTCRCGFVRVEVLPAGALDDSTPDSKSAPRSALISWIVIGMVTAAAVGTLVALQVMPVRPPSSASAVRGSEPDSMVSAREAEIANGRPTPPSLEAARGDLPDMTSTPALPDLPKPPEGSTLEDVVGRSLPAIVSIEAGQSRGSGFFAAPRTVITNRHVIQNNVSVMVRLSTGEALPGRVETTSSEYDLAIVRVDGALPSQSVLPLGTVNDVRPGQEVIAIGLALGVFQNSVTRGIISAVRRSEHAVMLQTDAAINPGNSGGPLLNRRGQVVGINTMKIAGSAESLGFAVAIDHARGMLSGGRPTEAVTATTQPTSPLGPAFASGSSTDTTRADGTRRYNQLVEAIARRSAQLDGYWDRIKANCALAIAPGYDHEWFAIWDGRLSLRSPDSSCSAAMRDLENLANGVRSAMAAAQDEARRASVLPGQLREIRRRHRMDWVGFDR
jgi:S1-C subfamily serine protease